MAQSASQAITGNNSFQQSIYVSSSDDLINLPVGINAVTINKNISTLEDTVTAGNYLVIVFSKGYEKYYVLHYNNGLYSGSFRDTDLSIRRIF